MSGLGYAAVMLGLFVPWAVGVVVIVTVVMDHLRWVP